MAINFNSLNKARKSFPTNRAPVGRSPRKAAGTRPGVRVGVDQSIKRGGNKKGSTGARAGLGHAGRSPAAPGRGPGGRPMPAGTRPGVRVASNSTRQADVGKFLKRFRRGA